MLVFGGSVTSISKRGHATFPGSGPDGFERSVELMGIVPVVSAVMGPNRVLHALSGEKGIPPAAAAWR